MNVCCYEIDFSWTLRDEGRSQSREQSTRPVSLGAP